MDHQPVVRDSDGLALAERSPHLRRGVAAWLTPTAAAAPPIHGDTLARQLVARSAAALGGLDRLRGLAAMRVEEEGHEYLISTPGHPDGPRRLIIQSLVTLRRYNPIGLRQHLTQTFPMRPGRTVQTLIALDSVAQTERQGRLALASAFDIEAAAEAIALAPDRVLLTASDAADLAARPDSVIGDTRYHVVQFRWRDATVRLAINAATWVPERLVLVRAYPQFVFWAMWGDIRLETVWSAWSIAPSGLWYPRQRTTWFNGERFRDYVVTALDPAPAVPADSFAIADSIGDAFTRSVRVPSPAPDPPLAPLAVTDGVVVFQGGYQSTLVRHNDGVIVIEAPESSAKSRAVLTQAAHLFPHLRVRAVISTSPMWMHIAGLREYAARGIPIYALDANARPVRALLDAPFVTTPDSLSRSGQRVRIRVVRQSMRVGDGANRLMLIPVRGTHGAAMMMVYWPERRLLYASDVISPPAFEPIFTSAYDAEFRHTIDRLGLAPTTVFALHLPPAAWPVMYP